ncbi:TPA: RIO1 family regulatory kinase/ATPase, partial [Streptococcus suis]
ENDSFTIYRNEVGNLKRLQKFKFVPRIIENFQDWDNYYLVEEFIDGDSLESYAAQYNTIVLGFDFIQVKKYIIKILNLFLKIVENVIELYKDGYIFTDLAPDNIIINQAGVYFIDLESVHEINDDKEVFSYTLNFYDKNKTDDENIKLSISNLLLFCFNKKSTLFDIFNADQILDPIIRRYPDIIEILHLIININNPKSNVMEIKNFIHETLNKIHLLPDKKKLDIKREDKISLSDSKYSISPNSLSFDGYINNRI